MRPLPRTAAVAGSVLLLHVAGLWALQSGLLLHRTVETIVPVELVSELITPPAPVLPTPPAPVPPPPVPPPPKPVPHVPRAAPVAPPAPRPVAIPERAPAPLAPVGVTEPQPAPAPVTTPVAAAPSPAPAPAPVPAPAPRIDLPTKDADYLRNPAPPYPPMSYRLGEEGLVIVHVLIGTDGNAQDAQVQKSSGYRRLDEAALKAARSWKYVPGKRGGVAEAMWVNVPVNWELKR